MVLRAASFPHPLGESLGKSVNFFHRRTAATLAAFGFEPLLKRSDYRGGQAFAGKMREFGGERIGAGVLEIKAMQNSTSDW